MKTIILVLSIITTIVAVAIPRNDLKQKTFPTGIINGNPVSIRKYPYLGSVHVDNNSESSLAGTGVILTDKWVLAAAGTVNNQLAENITIRIGSSFADHGGQVLKVSKIIVYPKFNSVTWNYDVALLKVQDTISFSDDVQKAIINDFTVFEGDSVYVAGFGSTLNPEDPRRLREIELVVAPADSWALEHQVIRTSDFRNGGPTIGDWGSPLTQVGSIYGTYIGNELPPTNTTTSTISSFTDLTVGIYQDWIDQTIENN